MYLAALVLIVLTFGISLFFLLNLFLGLVVPNHTSIADEVHYRHKGHGPNLNLLALLDVPPKEAEYDSLSVERCYLLSLQVESVYCVFDDSFSFYSRPVIVLTIHLARPALDDYCSALDPLLHHMASSGMKRSRFPLLQRDVVLTWAELDVVYIRSIV